MPFGLLCASGSKNDDSRTWQAHVELLDNSLLDLDLTKDTTGAGCLEIIGQKLGLSEVGYFGLQYFTKKGSEWWLELDKPVIKQLQRHAKDYTNCTLEFQVHFFVANIYCLQEEITRYLYYLQLKSNVLEGRLACTEEAAIVLASYIAQAELGDCTEIQNVNQLMEYELLPRNLVPNKSKVELYQQIFDTYKSYSGLSRSEAEIEFVTLTQQLEGYGDEYYPAKDNKGTLILIGATFLGIIIRHPHGLPPVCFKWPDIVHISYSKRYFCVETTKTLDTIQFGMEDSSTAKYVWKMFVGHHRFRRLNVTRTPREFEKSRPPKKMIVDRKMTLNTLRSKENMAVSTVTLLETSPENSESIDNNDCIDGGAYTPESGIINPLFEDNEADDDEDAIVNGDEDFASNFNIEPVVMRNNSKTNNKRPASSLLPEIKPKHSESPNHILDRPKSVDLTATDINQRPIQGHSEGFVQKNTGSSLGIGSSLSVDSGHPPTLNSSEFFNYGQSLDSLVETEDSGDMMMERTPDFTERSASSNGHLETQEQIKPVRPTSLNLEEVGGIWSNFNTKRTSGYCTSTDSDFSEDNWQQEDEVDEQLSRNEQLKELKKNLAEGQVFTEFQKIGRRSENLSVSTGSLLTNETKNRYNDILPYEETRVHLNPRNNVFNNDYINANHIKMKIGRTLYKYIASQGPMDKTVNDFWQMVWEQNVRLVVMATEEKVTSGSNCMRYWPEEVGRQETYGHCQIVTEHIQDASPYKIRLMKLRHVPSKQERTLYHLQFTDWPDHKIPDDPTNFLEFLDQMESLRHLTNSSLPHGEEKPPVVVHCTAGVGRTGVIILTDLMIACIQNNQRINIHRTLVQLRRQRMQLVANFGQYSFVYTTVIHYLKNSRLI
ncbi:tyrosine-protein phosphatase non-receptor type 21-like [Actinia tenebrosa]|uniref:protein-tyrosine-phosphatase n=1 Tax=Actinia tenebrosa TaxID=6105 RepID=A0A6P8I2L3_ACTTE|nr:tyrosine-protein phosphatase non-receptor type 21-like [Actinia tenebrosa]